MRLKLENTLRVIVATVVLHNIAVLVGDTEPGEDESLAHHLAMRRLQMLEDDYDSDTVQPLSATNYPGATGIRRAIINNHF